MKCTKMSFSILILIWKLNGTFGARFLSTHGLIRYTDSVRFWLFIFMKELKNELLKQIEINSMVYLTSMVYSLFRSNFVSSPLRFSTVQWSPRICCLENSWFILIFLITGCYFHNSFILIVNCDWKHINRGSHRCVFS